MKKEYLQFLGGLAVGIVVALIGIYLFNKDSLKFPRPNQPVNNTDNGPIDDDFHPSKPGDLRVSAPSVKMRSCPGLGCREVAILSEGAPVQDLGQTDIVDNLEWVRVRAEARVGWICRSFLE